jgi:hypothetical protein
MLREYVSNPVTQTHQHPALGMRTIQDQDNADNMTPETQYQSTYMFNGDESTTR